MLKRRRKMHKLREPMVSKSRKMEGRSWYIPTGKRDEPGAHWQAW
jgi:hypothetical protein